MIQQDCTTKYPILLVHGFALRDGKRHRIWGNIVDVLTMRGARVYVGRHDALGTIESNAKQLALRVDEILAETGCARVNIIAHSKGGLDSRRLVHMDTMADKVASITTIGTPHRGLGYVDNLNRRVPGCIFAPVGWMVSLLYRIRGDKNPTFRRTVRGFGTEEMRRFNTQYPDVEGVYYRSYSLIRTDNLRWRHRHIGRFDGDNDGIVSVESSKWSGYMGHYSEGIGHSTAIGYRRRKGYDAGAAMVETVSELARMGY